MSLPQIWHLSEVHSNNVRESDPMGWDGMGDRLEVPHKLEWLDPESSAWHPTIETEPHKKIKQRVRSLLIKL